MTNVVDDSETGTIPVKGVPPPCEDYTNQSDCETADCYWYAKYFWEEPSCHEAEQNMMMDYLPFIIAGAGGVIIIAAVLIPSKKPAHENEL